MFTVLHPDHLRGKQFKTPEDCAGLTFIVSSQQEGQMFFVLLKDMGFMWKSGDIVGDCPGSDREIYEHGTSTFLIEENSRLIMGQGFKSTNYVNISSIIYYGIQQQPHTPDNPYTQLFPDSQYGWGQKQVARQTSDYWSKYED